MSATFPQAPHDDFDHEPKTTASTTTLSAMLASTKPVKVKARGTDLLRVDLVISGKTAVSSTAARK